MDAYLGFVSTFLKLVAATLFLAMGVGMLVVVYLAIRLFIDLVRGRA